MRWSPQSLACPRKGNESSLSPVYLFHIEVTDQTFSKLSEGVLVVHSIEKVEEQVSIAAHCNNRMNVLRKGSDHSRIALSVALERVATVAGRVEGALIKVHDYLVCIFRRNKFSGENLPQNFVSLYVYVQCLGVNTASGELEVTF
jgi:hypothetical protein